MSSPDLAAARTAAGAGERIPALTGLRWWAALSVFLYHAFSVPGLFPPGVFGSVVPLVLGPGGAVGVSFFFVLSGFVLTWSARRPEAARSFWRRRFFRIVPNHWVCCLLVLALMLWTANTRDLHHVVQTLLLVQAWSPDFMAAIGLNGVSWTLSCEVVFYFCFPLLLWLVKKIRPGRLWLWAGVTVLAVFAFPLIASLFPAQPAMPFGPPVSEAAVWFVERLPLTRMAEFVLGILLARIVQERRWIRLPLWGAWLTAAAGYTVAVFTQGSLYGRVAVMLVPIALLIPAVAQRDIDGRPSLTARRPMVWLGNLAFAFYLLHLMVLEHLAFLFGVDPGWTTSGSVALIALAGGVAVLSAWLLHNLVEQPVYRRFARPAKRKAPDEAAARAESPAG
ncbi:acyltransferase family protein [Amycolatopsis sp. NBC_01480]|uniref:acyltransferase family protein n=1 Tax=Amycolatopsis sp. NBC_01480 TaxID=2903562 RepID=UPI002E299C4B|nr:acyltransferase [Amycolatopsis sp. NBC_01480]